MLLAAGLFLLLLTNLGSRGLNEPDEGRYAQIALEMSHPGAAWTEPRMSDFGHYDKPPLIYWMTAAAFRIFGTGEWAARTPPLIGAILALAGLGWAAGRLYGSRVAFWSVLFTGTMGQFWLLARFLTPDMVLTGFTTLGVAALVECRHRGGSWRWWGLALVFWTLGWWTKATPALIPLLGFALWVGTSGDPAGWRSFRPARLVAGILLLGSPWYLLMVHRHPELREFFLGRELVGRVAGHPDGRHGPVYLHLAVSLIGWLPWWPALLVGLALGAKRSSTVRSGLRVSFRRWPVELWILGAGLAVFSLISSKLPTYTLPLTPWAGLACARGWMWLAEVSRWPQPGRVWMGLAAGMASVFLGLSVVAPRIEDEFGRNSSLRPVVDVLRRKGADLVFCDRYWPGLEFYFGESVYYVTGHPPQERSDDSGVCPTLREPHFVPLEGWVGLADHHLASDVWLVSYKGDPGSPLRKVGDRHAIDETNRVGDFVLYHLLAATRGRVAGMPPGFR